MPRNLGGSVTDPSMKLTLQRLGYSNVEVVDTFGRIGFDEGELISLPFSGEHADLNIQSKHTFVVNIKGRKLFFLSGLRCNKSRTISAGRQDRRPDRRRIRRNGVCRRASHLALWATPNRSDQQA